jgi:hypothetical protein
VNKCSRIPRSAPPRTMRPVLVSSLHSAFFPPSRCPLDEMPDGWGPRERVRRSLPPGVLDAPPVNCQTAVPWRRSHINPQRGVGRATLVAHFPPLFSPRWSSNGRRVITCSHRFEYAIKLSHLPNLKWTHKNPLSLRSLWIRPPSYPLPRSPINLQRCHRNPARENHPRHLWNRSTLHGGEAMPSATTSAPRPACSSQRAVDGAAAGTRGLSFADLRSLCCFIARAH